MEYTINISQIYKCPMDNPTLGLKEKIQLAIVTCRSSDGMKILKISEAFPFSSIALQLHTGTDCDKGSAVLTTLKHISTPPRKGGSVGFEAS